MDGKKVRAVAEWTAPSKVADLRSFLGLANYYRRFIKGYSKIVNPLTDLLKKDQKWEWTVKCQSAFDLLKQAVSSEPVLKLPEFDKPFEVQTDASDRAIGGVLVQDKHPIAFESRKLKDAEMRYSTHEKEMTGVIHCLDAWKHYLLGTKFTVVTDNVANTYFKTQKKLTPKQARWQEFLGEYDFDWVHRPGKHNDVADALSRKAVEEYVAALTLIESDFLERIRESSQNDAVYMKLVEQVGAGHIRKYWLNDGLLYAKGGRAYVPSGPLRRQLLRETHDPQWVGHPGIDRMLALLSRRYYWPKMEYDVEAYVRTCLQTGGKSPAAYRFARAKQELLDEAKDSLSKAQRRMKKYADLGRRDVEFSVGENVLLKLTPQIWKKISSKTVHHGLIPKYDGPFEILKKVGNVAYRLRLPDRLKIHPTIHVSFLKKYHEDALKETRKQAARAPPVIRQEFDKDV
ncbi:hypothetical protein BUALT_Bualt09G0043400 [Buddleja alternifolia]|uniref:Reverse transcriptase/retrotransposon-derived protein RNase H-like domain-containing protein n=1 Tax=Buddleja alternifolia TaxID=168488 RepID=A0AAV6X813_9LAMI|nr:hypothetical protein BUALT_Bualt09G0043400 [Buddleja alternifolia]